MTAYDRYESAQRIAVRLAQRCDEEAAISPLSRTCCRLWALRRRAALLTMLAYDAYLAAGRYRLAA